MNGEPTYFVCGIDDCKGTQQNDSQFLTKYFELGWEVATTYFYAIHLKKRGLIEDCDTIVTCSGREFLYQSNFRNVISWSSLQNLNSKVVVSLVGKTLNGDFNSYYDSNGFYKYLIQDRELLKNFSAKNIDHLRQNEPFNVIVYRSRSHCDSRNTTADLIRSYIKLSNKHFKTFVVGHGSEIFEEAIKINLQEYCSLISDPLCHMICTPQTGLVVLARIFSQAKLILNYSVDGDFPKGNHHIINGYPEFFIQSKILKINRPPNLEEFTKAMYNYSLC